MNNIDTTTQIKWDIEKKILYIDFVGHITKNEMLSLIMIVEKELESISQKPIKALHNFKEAQHISLEAQVLFSERMQNPKFRKHAFVSINSRIRETIDVIIAIAEQNDETMRLFENQIEAEEWLTI